MYRYRKSKVFPVSGIGLWRWMSEVTRGRVDNENNSQSRYLNMSNIVQCGVYIYKSENITIRNRNITEFRSEHRKAMFTARETQECYVGKQNRNRNKIRNWNWDWD